MPTTNLPAALGPINLAAKETSARGLSTTQRLPYVDKLREGEHTVVPIMADTQVHLYIIQLARERERERERELFLSSSDMSI
jgi:hypothetical protein